MSGDSVNAEIQQANLLIERGRYDEARRTIAGGLSKKPGDETLMYLRAWVELADEELEAAEQTAQELLAIAPESYGGREILFHVYKDTKRLAQAEEIVIGLIRSYPEEPAGYANYSRLMLRTHNFAKAEALAKEALKLDPESHSALLSIALCQSVKGRLDPDIDLQELIKTSPHSRSTLAMLMGSLAEAGRTREALRLAEELVRAYPREQTYVDAVIALRTATHWLMKPLWPMQRFGWGASAAIWVLVVVAFNTFGDNPYIGYFVYFWIVYCIYSWVVPPLLSKWMKR